jgi:hypothetical protein
LPDTRDFVALAKDSLVNKWKKYIFEIKKQAKYLLDASKERMA